jgi:outer membrane protein
MIKIFSIAIITLSICVLVPSSSIANGLTDVYLIAKNQDPIIREADANYQASAMAHPLARASLLPQINFTAETSENRLDTKGATFGVPGRKVNFNSNGYRLSLIQSLYNRNFIIQLRQSKNTVARAQIELDLSQQNLILRTAEAYFEVLAARDNLRFIGAEKGAIEQQRDQAVNRFEVGLSAITDVKEAQSSYDLAVAKEIEARNNLELSLDNLTMITGSRIVELSQLAQEMMPLDPQPNDMQSWIDSALNQNLRLLINEYDTTIAHQQIELSRSGYHPTLDIVASHNDSESGGLSGKRKTEESRVGLELNIPLFVGGRNYYQTKESRYRYEAALQAHEQIRREVKRDTAQAFHNVIASVSRVNALAKALESAHVSAEANNVGFEVGTRTSVDVLIALQAVYEAQSNFARSRYDYLLNTLKLRLATGTLNVDDLANIDQWLQ